jgi:transposase
MSATLEEEAEIRRLYFAEHWPVGTVSAQLHHHPEVVRRVLGLDTRRPSPAERLLLVEPYKDFIAQTLKKYPTLRATRLFDMVKPRGYPGEVRTLRAYVATVRPRPPREAYLRVSTLPGEQAQVDWAHVGKVRVPGGERPLWAFVMVLSWSRAMWGEFIFDLSVHSLRRSLARAAEYFGGNTRQWLFDNPKTVVLERHGDAVRFHPRLLDASSHYCVSLRLCTVRKPNQKGRVERAIRYVRERFLEGRELRSVVQANAEFLTFLNEVANPRPHPTLPGVTVADCLAQEKPRLLRLPDVALSTEEVVPVTVDKTAFVRFDTNDYSVPHEYAQVAATAVTVAADDVMVRVLHGGVEVARHTRCWGRRQSIEEPSHREALLAQKRGASDAKGQERLRAIAPNVDQLFERWVDTGRNVGSLTARLAGLLRSYDDATVAAAVTAVLASGTHDVGAVAVVCEQLRRKANKPVPLDVALGSHVPDRDVIPHALEGYDGKSKRRV